MAELLKVSEPIDEKLDEVIKQLEQLNTNLNGIWNALGHMADWGITTYNRPG